MQQVQITPELMSAISLRMRQRKTPPRMTERFRFGIECSGVSDVFPELRQIGVVNELWRQWLADQSASKSSPTK